MMQQVGDNFGRMPKVEAIQEGSIDSVIARINDTNGTNRQEIRDTITNGSKQEVLDTTYKVESTSGHLANARSAIIVGMIEDEIGSKFNLLENNLILLQQLKNIDNNLNKLRQELPRDARLLETVKKDIEKKIMENSLEELVCRITKLGENDGEILIELAKVIRPHGPSIGEDISIYVDRDIFEINSEIKQKIKSIKEDYNQLGKDIPIIEL